MITFFKGQLTVILFDIERTKKLCFGAINILLVEAEICE